MNTNKILAFPGHNHDSGATARHLASAQVLPWRPRLSQPPTAHAGNAATPIAGDEFGLGRLWQAILEDRVVVHYQPQYDLSSGRTVAVEALVRAVDERGELVFPDRFIGQAEASGMIVPLGRRVIEHVCRDLAAWRRQGLAIERVAINLSAHQLNIDTVLVSFIETTVMNHGLELKHLEFELTERQMLHTEGVGTHALLALSAAGARLAIDDFGVGFSSISYLTQLPIDTVKLDRSLVQHLPHDHTSDRVTFHLVAMAADLGLQVVAEGVEHQAQNDYLAIAGCHLAQGYLVARPMPRDDLEAHLKT